jgi:predicted nuclease of restriction endonuclease-like (RecB) superfamily
MNEYFKQIDELITNRETTRRVRNYVENEETLVTYWHVGKLLSEAGTKYGEGTIKNWSILLTEKYGKGYNYTNLTRMKQFYGIFLNIAAMSQLFRITWSNYVILITIKENNKRNYYLNLCLKNNITSRRLNGLIKNNTYEKLPFNERSQNIEIDKVNNNLNIIPIKNPIIIDIHTSNFKEKALLKYFIEHIDTFLADLGNNYAYIASEYSLFDNNKKYKIDILLFNYEINCFVVVELKVRELQNKDIDQIINYMNLIDEIKKPINKTRGILITKEDDGYRLSYCNERNIERTTYLNMGISNIN